MSDSHGNQTADGQAHAGPSDTRTAELLERLLERVQHIDGVVSRLEGLADQAPPLVATAVDTLDEAGRRASAAGVDLDVRLDRVLRLADRLTADGTFDALERLLGRVEQIEAMSRALDQLPGFLATLGDVFDDWAARMNAQGIDLDTSLRQGLHAALWLGGRISEAELDRLGLLIRSDVLDPHALAVVAKVGRAIATCHEGACEARGPERIGPLGVLGALRDPDVQRSLAFAVQVARCFGGHLPEPAEIPPSRALADQPPG